MATKEIKTYSLTEMKDKYVGKIGTTDRDEYEYELRMDVLGKMIKSARQERHLTQEELAQLVGASRETVNKALADFVQREWIKLEPRAVLLLDVDRLEKRAR